MLKNFYIAAWILLVGAASTSAFYGNFGSAEAVATSFGALGRVYGLALWAVFRDRSPDGASSSRAAA